MEDVAGGMLPQLCEGLGGLLILKALGSLAPSTLTRMAIEGCFGQGAPAVQQPLWGIFMPQALVGPLTVREQALVHVQ